MNAFRSLRPIYSRRYEALSKDSNAFAKTAHTSPLSTSSTKDPISIDTTAPMVALGPSLIPWTHMQLVCVAGLRGALNYSLATLFPDTFGHRDLVLACTAVVVVASICVLGGATAPMVRYLGLSSVDSPAGSHHEAPPAHAQEDWEARWLESWLLPQSSSTGIPGSSLHSACCYGGDVFAERRSPEVSKPLAVDNPMQQKQRHIEDA